MCQVLPGDLMKLRGPGRRGCEADLFPRQPPPGSGAGAVEGRADPRPLELVGAGASCGLLSCGLGAQGRWKAKFRYLLLGGVGKVVSSCV